MRRYVAGWLHPNAFHDLAVRCKVHKGKNDVTAWIGHCQSTCVAIRIGFSDDVA